MNAVCWRCLCGVPCPCKRCQYRSCMGCRQSQHSSSTPAPKIKISASWSAFPLWISVLITEQFKKHLLIFAPPPFVFLLDSVDPAMWCCPAASGLDYSNRLSVERSLQLRKSHHSSFPPRGSTLWWTRDPYSRIAFIASPPQACLWCLSLQFFKN